MPRSSKLKWAQSGIRRINEQSQSPEVPLCPHCGAKIVEYRHALNTPLIRALAKLYQHGDAVNLRELNLDRNEWDNFQKLKYWGLVYQVEVEGKRKKGVWWLTLRGVEFIEGRLRIPKSVWTYRGRRKRFEGIEVSCSDFLETNWRTRTDYAQKASN